MTIKKQFVELIELLSENKDRKVKDILSQVVELATSKKKSETFRKDADGNITHIFCYYHKEWEPVSLYGKKVSSHTGYNTMCKVGVNRWTKQQSDAQKAKTELLSKVQSGKLAIDQIASEMDKIEEERQVIIPLETV